MYEFIDVTEIQETALPSEAMQINGEYIENMIAGYRTLHVKGREALSSEIDSYETGVRDGSKLRSKRYPARVITVTYQLIADSNEAFREAYNKLGRILDVTDARLIFNDEPDKYFTGTPSGLGEVEAGRNAVTSEIEITCFDPFKYSVVEYEATPALDESSILIEYNGTYKAHPILEAHFYEETDEDGLTGNGDCGYVAFFTEDEKIIQLGNPDEADGADLYPKSQTLINQTFQQTTSTTAGWTANSGHVLPDVTQVGTTAIGTASYATPASGGSTSANLITVWSDSGLPSFKYVVTAKTSGRTGTSVKVTVTITASMKNTTSYFGVGLGLQGSVYMGGSWHNVTIKEQSANWTGRTAHTVNISFTVSGLTSTTTSITGIQFRVTRTDSGVESGAVSAKNCAALPVSVYTTAQPATYYLTASSYGTGSAWHGAALTRPVPQDTAGETGAADFTLTYSYKLCIGDTAAATAQIGGLHVHVADGSGRVIAGARVVKSQSGKTALVQLFVNGAAVWQSSTDASYTASGSKTATITKSGGTVTFNVAGVMQKFYKAELEDVKAEHITIMFDTYGSKAPMAYNGLYWLKFVKDSCDTYADIPNKFTANDVVIADCKNCSIYLNGILTPPLGALANDWEGFVLTEGLNQIGLTYSSWVPDDYKPSFVVRYREVFL